MKKKWKSKKLLENKEGYILLEFIIGLSLYSVIILAVYYLFMYSNILNEKFNLNSQKELEINYFYDYIEGEIKEADVIFDVSGRYLGYRYRNNLGFIMGIRDDYKYKETRYICYYLDGETIRRVAYTGYFTKEYKNIKISEFAGHNDILEGVKILDSKLSLDKKKVDITLEIDINNQKYRRSLTIRCPIIE